MRRGQMELVGLVVIVILISVGLLFLAQFALKDDPGKKIFTRKGLATSTLSALMKTTVVNEGCLPSEKPLQVEADLLEDCALNNPKVSPTLASRYACRSEHTCVFLRSFLSERLNETLGAWNKRYELQSRMLVGDTEEILFEPILGNGGCPKSRERDTSNPFPLSTPAGLVESVLYVCD